MVKPRKKQVNFRVIDSKAKLNEIYQSKQGRELFEEFLKHEHEGRGLRFLHFLIESGNKILLGFHRQKTGIQPLALTVFKEGPKRLETDYAFVSKKFRRQGIALKLTYHLTALARSKGKILVRPFQVEEMIRLATKIKRKPRKIYVGGKAAGKAETIRIKKLSVGVVSNVIIKPKPVKRKRRPR